MSRADRQAKADQDALRRFNMTADELDWTAHRERKPHLVAVVDMLNALVRAYPGIRQRKDAPEYLVEFWHGAYAVMQRMHREDEHFGPWIKPRAGD